MTRVYADNAATSFPKPPCMMEAIRSFAETVGASAGRGGYREAVEAGGILSQCRRNLARLINASSPECVVLGHNCTDMLNLAIRGTLRVGDHVVTTSMEHNSVQRPLNALQIEGLTITRISGDATGLVAPTSIESAINDRTRLVVIQHVSNVTGTIQPISEIGAICRARGVLLLVDAAQSVGHIPVDVQSLGADMLAFPGHKALLGPTGTGGLYVRPGVEKLIRPLKQGGSGSMSESPLHPENMPERFESGTHNMFGIAGLNASVQWILHRTVDEIARHDRELSAQFLGRVAEVPGITIHGPATDGDTAADDNRVAVFSLSIGEMEPTDAAAILDTEFNVLARAGLHCAPGAHETIGTLARGGTIRFSFGALSTESDVTICCDAIAALAQSA